MGKRIRDYVKYTLPELENYTKRVESCVKKVQNNMHLNMQPYALGNIKKTILHVIATKKIGFFDIQLNGIILDIKNIKILGDVAPISNCDPNVHLNIEADFYIFQPEVGAVVRGVVKYISARQIGVTIYRVFSVSIRLQHKVDKTLELNSEIEFRIKNFDLQNVMPFIEGELVTSEVKSYDKTLVKQISDAPSSQNKTSVKQIKTFEESDSSPDSVKAANSSNFTSLARSISPYAEDQNESKFNRGDQFRNNHNTSNIFTNNGMTSIKKEKIAKSNYSPDLESEDIFASQYSDSEEKFQNTELGQRMNETSSQKKKQRKQAINLEINNQSNLKLFPKIKKEKSDSNEIINCEASHISSDEEEEYNNMQSNKRFEKKGNSTSFSDCLVEEDVIFPLKSEKNYAGMTDMFVTNLPDIIKQNTDKNSSEKSIVDSKAKHEINNDNCTSLNATHSKTKKSKKNKSTLNDPLTYIEAETQIYDINKESKKLKKKRKSELESHNNSFENINKVEVEKINSNITNSPELQDSESKFNRGDQFRNTHNTSNIFTNNGMMSIKKEKIAKSNYSRDLESEDIFASQYSNSEENFQNTELGQRMNETSSQKKKQRKQIINLEINNQSNLKLFPKIKKEKSDSNEIINCEASHISSDEEEEYNNMQSNKRFEKKGKSTSFNDCLVEEAIIFPQKSEKNDADMFVTNLPDIIKQNTDKNSSEKSTVDSKAKHEINNDNYTSLNVTHSKTKKSKKNKSTLNDSLTNIEAETQIYEINRESKKLKKKRKSESESHNNALEVEKVNLNITNSPELQGSADAAVKKKKRAKTDFSDDCNKAYKS